MFSGFFLKINNIMFPQKYIVASGYKATPHHRLDLSSDRDAEGGLIREVASNRPSSLSVQLCCDDNIEWMEVSNLLYDNMISEDEKSLLVTFYNPERDNYITEKMYWSDTDYQIDSVSGDRVQYGTITLEFTGY